MNKKICAVIVTYNRLEKLKNTLSAYSNQSKRPDSLVVFDNNSNDGTAEFLKSWKNENKNNFDIDVILNGTNEGGAGGFNKALSIAITKNCDWIWISDDDAYPNEEAFEILKRRIDLVDESVGVICSTVMQGGKIAQRHRRRFRNSIVTGVKEICVKNDEYRKDFFELNLYTFVGTCIRKEVLKEVGLPNAGYFIWYDDTEHSMRVNQKYKIVCDPKIVVVHDVPVSRREKTWKGFYANRNRLYTYHKHLHPIYFCIYELYYKVQLVIFFLIDKRTYKIKVSAYKEFKNNLMGISENYKPGTKV